MAKVIGWKPEAVGRQNNDADGEAGTSKKKCRRGDAGQSMEPGMLGRGMSRKSSLCCRVFVQQMRRNATDWWLGSKEVTEATVKFNLQRKEKKAVQNNAQSEKEVRSEKEG